MHGDDLGKERSSWHPSHCSSNNGGRIRGKMASEADVGRVQARLWVRCVELRMEGQCIRLAAARGAAALTCDVVAVDNLSQIGHIHHKWILGVQVWAT